MRVAQEEPRTQQTEEGVHAPHKAVTECSLKGGAAGGVGGRRAQGWAGEAHYEAVTP